MVSRAFTHTTFNINVEGGRRRPRKKEEQSLQERLVQVLIKTLPANCFFFAVPNGGSRDVREAVALKRAGVVRGVPDLIFCHEGRFIGLELKSEKGTLSDAQRAVHPLIAQAGGRVEVARSIAEACDRLRECGIPIRQAWEVA